MSWDGLIWRTQNGTHETVGGCLCCGILARSMVNAVGVGVGDEGWVVLPYHCLCDGFNPGVSR